MNLDRDVDRLLDRLREAVAKDVEELAKLCPGLDGTLAERIRKNYFDDQLEQLSTARIDEITEVIIFTDNQY